MCMPVRTHIIFGREQRQREGTGEAALTELLSPISGYLQRDCRMLVLLQAPSTGQHRPRQSHCSGRDLWFTCTWPTGMAPSQVNFGCVWYELRGRGTGDQGTESDLRVEITENMTKAQRRDVGSVKKLRLQQGPRNVHTHVYATPAFGFL